MKFEFSAGGLVYKIKNGKIMFLLLKDQNGNWTFPKGLIEQGEEKIKTAKREIEEEAGLTKIKFEREIDQIEYWYKFKGELIRKRVYYFLFKQEKDEVLIPQSQEGITEAAWFLPERALKIIGYKKTNEKILKKAMQLLKEKRFS